jgi:hypothetical protein
LDRASDFEPFCLNLQIIDKYSNPNELTLRRVGWSWGVCGVVFEARGHISGHSKYQIFYFPHGPGIRGFAPISRCEYQIPELDPTSSNFGKISQQANLARNVQIGLKMIF